MPSAERSTARPAPASAAAPCIPTLLAGIYACAPGPERARLLEHLLRPLRLPSLNGIADGAFAGLSGPQPVQLRPEDIGDIHAAQVMALAEHAAQAGDAWLDGLAPLIAHSPAMARSALAGILFSALAQRARIAQDGASRPH